MPRAYYNEIDPFAAQWIRNLIAAGHVMAGDVDERSIVNVRPDDLVGYDRCHFFAGIAVWDYALGLADWPAGRQVWTGSCPCQPFSAAGKGGGISDERHLWPAFFHLIEQCRPATVLGEQVASKDGLDWLDLVHADLEGAHYDFGAVDLCAAGVGAPHIRQRLWFVANAGCERCDGEPSQLRRPGSGGRLPANCSEAPWSSPAGRSVADVLGPGLEGRNARSLGDKRATAERGSAASSLVDADLVQRERSATAGRQARHRTQQRGSTGLLGNAERQWLRSQRCRPDAEATRGMPNSDWQRQWLRDELGTAGGAGFWSDADWIPCRDGKARPVEPGTFPLAHGAASRVGRLRAYGNAINAEAAAAFISACLDVLP